MSKDSNKGVSSSNFDTLLRRYQGATPEALIAVLCPLLVPIIEIDKTVKKDAGQSHFHATFKIAITNENKSAIVRGRTGKFVPGDFSRDGAWREVAKGRILKVEGDVGFGEIYTGQASSRTVLEAALTQLNTTDFLEIDQYGAAAKVLSGLAEFSLVEQAQKEGYEIYRMPEDMARHLGSYANYDFELQKEGVRKRVEVKSLWGTNTNFARLIHSTTTRPSGNPTTWTPDQRRNYYPTSSCRFETQDIFAVNLFLKTGNIKDFAFARSVSAADKPYGLPPASGFPEHVNQNPTCVLGDGKWFKTIAEVWDLP